MSRPVWFVELLKVIFPGRYLAAKMTKLPLLGNLIDYIFFDGDYLVYLPQDRVIQINEPIEAPDDMVLPSQVVDAMINKANVHWVMNSCICRASSGCQDYPIDLGCLFLGEAAEGINPKLGHRVTREEALAHVQRARKAGLVHLIGRNKLDTIWLGVEPGERLLTICHCCPCCCLWRILPHLRVDIGRKISPMPGVEVVVSDRCVGCGTCTQEVCFVDAIRLVDGRAVISEACRGCGRCVEVCPEGAIEISIPPEMVLETTVNHLSDLVDVS